VLCLLAVMRPMTLFPRDSGRGCRFFCFLVVRFGEIDEARQFLCMVSLLAGVRGEIVWFDTDYGWVISSEEFLRAIDGNPAYDWRYPVEVG
jgi:hypothetical protein